ncbi:MAG TPA: proton-translocating NADH-quinone oxidoreductase subunit M [Verrucomicrobiales bacterium]|jgi:NADH-quinone oxidoreductase subunit M|nr:NADH-quinone oxidoreductase subunit M [Pedosphaera sp.]HAL04981.1 proton-translocating NADH-quinone oxidoreductase subunit M [Verrucomicrobiales bacterium]|tara:strand:- start:1824 stop:3338 length:1515 start_codon:yes stop_codon:yes gene_type:complete
MDYLFFIVMLPLFAGLVVGVIPGDRTSAIRGVTLGASGLTALLALVAFCSFDPDGGLQFETEWTWVESLGLKFYLAADGINIGIIFMGAVVAFAAVCCAGDVTHRIKEFYFLLNLMICGILGAFASMDLFFFYFFHELALVPTFIMIGVWGRGQNRNYATYKITLYLSFGALLALIGLIGVYVQTGAESFSIPDLMKAVEEKPIMESAQQWIFPLLMFGFGILVSLWPFHTWAPLGYGAAPTATAMLHAGVLKKFGLYGLIRVAIPMAPAGAQTWLEVLAWLALANLLFCGLVAVRQKDLNQLIGNSSVAHMGFIFLGIASLNVIGLTGAVLVMIAHGLLAALAFGLSGHLYQQHGSLDMTRMGGLLRKMPLAGTALLMAMMAGCGLPGFANFAGEITIFFAAWSAGFQIITVIAAWSALVIGGLYMLRAIRNILHGSQGEDWDNASDAKPLVATAFGLLLAMLLVFGFAPNLLTKRINSEVEKIVRLAKPEGAAPEKVEVVRR